MNVKWYKKRALERFRGYRCRGQKGDQELEVGRSDGGNPGQRERRHEPDSGQDGRFVFILTSPLQLFCCKLEARNPVSF